jgi:cytochrome P450
VVNLCRRGVLWFYVDNWHQYGDVARFRAGPRICLGKHFALLEATIALSEVASRHSLRLVPGHQIKPTWSGTLRPDRDVMMTLHLR